MLKWPKPKAKPKAGGGGGGEEPRQAQASDASKISAGVAVGIAVGRLASKGDGPERSNPPPGREQGRIKKDESRVPLLPWTKPKGSPQYRGPFFPRSGNANLAPGEASPGEKCVPQRRSTSKNPIVPSNKAWTASRVLLPTP